MLFKLKHQELYNILNLAGFIRTSVEEDPFVEDPLNFNRKIDPETSSG